MKTKLGDYLASVRLTSGAKSISEYLKDKSLSISETYYRALESGDKNPTTKTVEDLAQALGADKLTLFQYFLEDMLPPDVYKRLIQPVSTATPTGTPKEALERKEELLNAYRAALQKLQLPAGDFVEDVYVANDEMVNFLNENFHYLPIVHAIYLKEGEVTEKELKEICRANNIVEDLRDILTRFRAYQIADIRQVQSGRSINWLVRRFRQTFRLPQTEKGRSLRTRWAEWEFSRSLKDLRGEQINRETTFSLAQISCYRNSHLAKVQERILDLLAELNAATEDVEEPNTTAFFVTIMASPRPEYVTGLDKRKPQAQGKHKNGAVLRTATKKP